MLKTSAALEKRRKVEAAHADAHNLIEFTPLGKFLFVGYATLTASSMLTHGGMMPSIITFPLEPHTGAGQEVGRSCMILKYQ